MTLAPIVLFAYARPTHLEATLKSLRENNAGLIYAFSDAAKSPGDSANVERVREMLHGVDWCEMVISERETNFGLGRSIVAGVTEVLSRHSSAIVVEDDLVFVPGTLEYLSAALDHYADDDRVMSVTGWTHPRVTPSGVSDQPYFDGRAECWIWGTWARAWKGMDTDALTLMNQCRANGIDPYRYGADLVEMAGEEAAKNIWAVRFLYLHMLRRGLCMRPPWSMVEHMGFDQQASNAVNETWLRNPPLRSAPPIPEVWPAPTEAPECAKLHQAVGGSAPQTRSTFRAALGRVANSVRRKNAVDQ